jgi:hypothetical protein
LIIVNVFPKSVFSNRQNDDKNAFSSRHFLQLQSHIEIPSFRMFLYTPCIEVCFLFNSTGNEEIIKPYFKERREAMGDVVNNSAEGRIAGLRKTMAKSTSDCSF